jgi:CO dehydrogenase/acetyl-CoA synthase delta subunit
MPTHTPTGVNWADAVEPLEASRRARVVASFAEYLADDGHGHPERAPEAMASLAEWCEGDALLLARARADVLRDTRGVQAAVAENNREAAKLLELVASA